MEPITVVGMIAAFCTTSAFIPQVVQILRTGNVDGISLQMYSIFTLGVALWLGYGVVLQSSPIIISNSITLALAVSVLGLTLSKRRKNRMHALRLVADNSDIAVAPAANEELATAA
ncbi:SemiSWEET family sugar transporter [Marinobacterium sp. YM272]|uniref:SemiSWEET family sugar transporter n=1 Tax=Marinobacterium sp. YM272 TaxID=3421654 RepID=UPI003D7FB071